MELAPATIDQLRQSNDGRWVLIDRDVGMVADRIQELARELEVTLQLRVSERTGIFSVVQIIGNVEHLVTTAQELDGRLVERVRQITSPRYDLATELEKLEAEKQAEFDGQQTERTAELGERLAHAIRKDTGEEKVSIILPRGVEG